MSGPLPDRPVLVLDTASPVVSVAVGLPGGTPAAERTLDLRRSSELLLRSVEEALEEAGCAVAELGGVVALRGPGSFTGLRIGLATVLGFHQALGLPATAADTFDVLASVGGSDADESDVDVVAAVDALRGDWSVRRYPKGAPPGDHVLVAAAELASFAPCRLVGFGVASLAGTPGFDATVELVEPPPLASPALVLASRIAWDPDLLVRPVYFRPPAVTPPRQT